MDPDTIPSLTHWTPGAILFAVITITGIIGTAIGWAASNGLKTWMEYRTFRLKERAELAKLPVPPKKEFSTEQLFEDTELSTGYKIMMYQQDKRIRELEGSVMDLNSRWQKCVQDHAAADARADSLQKQLADMQKQFRKRQEESGPPPNHSI